MARYIDADKLCKGLEEMAAVLAPFKQSTILGVVETIENMPTADVIPKEFLTRKEDEAYARGYAEAKTEVVGEIFEEIEAEITEALKSNYKRHAEYYTKERYKKEDGEFINTVNGKIDALRGIDGFIAELKKKYEEPKV